MQVSIYVYICACLPSARYCSVSRRLLQTPHLLTFRPKAVTCISCHSEPNLRQRPYQLTCWLTRRWTSASMLVVLGCSRRGSLLLGRSREATAEIPRACGQPRCRQGVVEEGQGVCRSGGFKWFHCSYDVTKGIPKPNVPRASNDKMADMGRSLVEGRGPVALLPLC